MLTDYEKDIVRNVAEHGWFCVCVGVPASDPSNKPSFAYSVGFWETLRKPELIVFGLPLKLMHSMLWEAFRQLKAGTAQMNDGERWSNLIDGFECISRPVHQSQIRRETFNSALWYRRHQAGGSDDLSAFQLFWPGKVNGRFPWEADSSESVRELQPQLYLPRSVGIA